MRRQLKRKFNCFFLPQDSSANGKTVFFSIGGKEGKGRVKWSGVVSGNWGGLFYWTEGDKRGKAK